MGGHAFSELFFGVIYNSKYFGGFSHFLGNLFIISGLQTKWNQNHHKTYTLRINKTFKFYPTWYLLP